MYKKRFEFGELRVQWRLGADEFGRGVSYVVQRFDVVDAQLPVGLTDGALDGEPQQFADQQVAFGVAETVGFSSNRAISPPMSGTSAICGGVR